MKPRSYKALAAFLILVGFFALILPGFDMVLTATFPGEGGGINTGGVAGSTPAPCQAGFFVTSVNSTTGAQLVIACSAVGWTQLTGYPSGCATNKFVISIGASLTCSSVSWVGLTNFPAACAVNKYVRQVGVTLTCTQVGWTQLTAFPGACPAAQFVSTIAATVVCSDPILSPAYRSSVQQNGGQQLTCSACTLTTSPLIVVAGGPVVVMLGGTSAGSGSPTISDNQLNSFTRIYAASNLAVWTMIPASNAANDVITVSWTGPNVQTIYWLYADAYGVGNGIGGTCGSATTSCTLNAISGASASNLLGIGEADTGSCAGGNYITDVQVDGGSVTPRHTACATGFNEQPQIYSGDFVGIDSPASHVISQVESGASVTNTAGVELVALQSVPWANIINFPAGCGAGQFVQSVGGTLTCTSPPTGFSSSVISCTISTASKAMSGMPVNYTTSGTGTIYVTLDWQIASPSTASSVTSQWQLAYGTGTAPTCANTSLSGTLIGNQYSYDTPSLASATVENIAPSETVVVTGLSASTKYWFELQVLDSSAASWIYSNPQLSVIET